MRGGMDSKMWLLCLLLSMEMTQAQSNKTPRFGLLVPPDLYHPSTATFCLHSSGDLQGYIHISVDLKTSSGSTSLYTVQPGSPTWHCQSFQVPEPSGTTETVTISVQGQEAGGNKVEFSSKDLTMRRKSTGTLIQTDKAVYNPGQKVQFRMVTMDQDMKVLKKTHPMVELQDPHKNRLAQWKDVHADSLIVELSYQLPPEAVLGAYSIRSGDVSLSFRVDQYVLPKFEVKIEGPKSISILDKEVTISVCGMYTYGEKVQGNVTFKMCQKKRPRYYWWRRTVEKDKKEDLCHNQNVKIDRSGKLQFVVNLSQFCLRDSDYARQLEVEASLEEEGTEVEISTSNTFIIIIQSQFTKLSFKDTKRYYQPGALYRGKLVLESYDGKRLADRKVHLSIPEKEETKKETYVTDSAGEVSFQLSTSQWGKRSLSLRATTDEEDEPYSQNTESIRYGKANLYIEDIYSGTNSSVHIRPVKSLAQPPENVIVVVDYTVEEPDRDSIEFFYLVLDNSVMTLGGQKTVQKAEGLSGSLEFTFSVENLTSSVKFMVFTVSPSGGIAADTTEVQVPSNLRHKVSLQFSEGEVLPGSDVQLHLQANGGSVCALRVVDRSVTLLNPAAELSESKIKNLVRPKRTYIKSRALDYDYCRDTTREPNSIYSGTTESWDRWGGWAYPEKKKDFQNIIQDMGILLLSSWDIVAPTTCRWRDMKMTMMKSASRPSQARPMAKAPAAVLMSSPDIPTSAGFDDEEDDDGSRSETRTLFPETWLWEMKEVSASGSAVIPATAPHTITEWSAQMFCAGPGGLGLSVPASLKTFQPFFIDLTLPYSIKRKERFLLKGSIFNYMSQPMEISASLSPSDQFTIKKSGTSENFCLPGGAKKTLIWDVTPTIIGQMNISFAAEAVRGKNLCGGQQTMIPKKGGRDAVIRSVLVVPEGNSVEKTHNSLLVSDGGSVSETVIFQLPSSYVLGSVKTSISVCGDIMGSSMGNIGNLLTMSYGCGEQNMARFAPNVYILGYMKKSDVENRAVLEKGTDMLEKGYTRQLMYKRSDGSYSAFGMSDPEGSTWLTAFVVKCLIQAKEYVFIDDQVINEGMAWLKKQQKPNGCFKTTGRLLNNGLKGGVDDEISLTAYVAAALMESGTESSDPVVEQAMMCIRNESVDDATPYKLSLKAYAFTLCRDEENRAAVMQKLDEKATKADGLLYWTQETKSSSESYWSKPKSVDVEMTAYVLLSYSSKQTPTKKESGNMAAIVRWLTKQQNANGGFASTQDTVVALQALTNFASCISSVIGAMTVDVTSEDGFHHRFHMDNANRLLLHKIQLPEISREYNVTVSGKGSIIMQAVQTYNVLPVAKEDAFVLTVNPVCVKSDLLQISLEFCYTGNRQSTNMVFLQIKMLSGFVPQKASVDELKKNPRVKRVETDEDTVSIYIEEVTSELQTLALQAERTVPVSDLKPAIIKMFDYYIPEEEKTISYSMNC